ncbi:MAG: DinB family protein [Flavobacteriaceae bacterium]
MTKQFEINRFSRNILLALTQDLSLEQYNAIPKGFKNNIAWNLGHILITQQMLTHGLAGVPFAVDTALVAKFGKGSECQENYKLEEIEVVKATFLTALEATEKAYNSSAFKNYKTYTTSQGFSLNSIEDGIVFSNFHEGMHMGIIMALKKLI